MKKIYNMIEEKKEWFEKSIKKYNRLARKHGMAGATYTYKKKTIEGVTVQGEEGEEYTVPMEVIPVEIEFEDALEKNCTHAKILAKLIHVENMINIYDEEVYKYYSFDKLKQLEPWCDHCNTRRKRNVTYIVEMNGKVLQIARTCLAEQTCVPNIEVMMQMTDLLQEMDNELNDVDYQFEKSKYSGIPFYSVENILSVTKDIIEKYGYVSKKRAYESLYEEGNTLVSTAVRVQTQVEYGKKGKEDVKSLIAEYLNFDFREYIEGYEETDRNYFFKMKKILTYDKCSIVHVGMLSSFFMALDSIRKKIEPKNNIEEKFVGEVGEKISMLVTLDNINIYENGYGGFTYYYYFKTTQNDSVVWKASKDIELEKGDKMLLTGTVKRHKENGKYKTTYVSRCKVNKEVA